MQRTETAINRELETESHTNPNINPNKNHPQEHQTELPVEPKKKAGKLQIGLIVFSLVFLVFFLIKEDGISSVPLLFQGKYALMIGVACLCMLVSWLAEAGVLFFTVRSSSVPIHYGTAFRICMIGLYFNTVTPLSTGGQPSQAYQLHKRGMSYGEAVSGLYSKFLTYQVTYTVYCAVILILQFTAFRNSQGNLVFLSLIGFVVQIAVSLGLLSMAFFKKGTTAVATGLIRLLGKLRIFKAPDRQIERLLKEIDTFHSQSREVFRQKKRLLISFLLTMVQLTAFYSVGYALYLCFASQIDAGFFTILSSQVFIALISSVVPLPGAVGAAEGSFYYFFQLYFPASVLSLVMILWRMMTFYMPLLVGLMMTITWRKQKVPVKNED